MNVVVAVIVIGDVIITGVTVDFSGIVFLVAFDFESV